jgi:hypothetical protein
MPGVLLTGRDFDDQRYPWAASAQAFDHLPCRGPFQAEAGDDRVSAMCGRAPLRAGQRAAISLLRAGTDRDGKARLTEARGKRHAGRLVRMLDQNTRARPRPRLRVEHGLRSSSGHDEHSFNTVSLVKPVSGQNRRSVSISVFPDRRIAARADARRDALVGGVFADGPAEALRRSPRRRLARSGRRARYRQGHARPVRAPAGGAASATTMSPMLSLLVYTSGGSRARS